MFGVASMTEPLRRVAVRRPGAAMTGADAKRWHYGPAFDPQRVQDCHDAFVGILCDSGVDVLRLDGDDRGNADAVFTYDASLMAASGAVLMSPGKHLRRGEQDLHRDFYAANGIPIIGAITGDGRAEAGDMFWVDAETLAVGRGIRTNQAGIDQMTAIMAPLGVTVHAFDLPLYYGADACMHLLSLISPVDRNTALARLPLLPVALWMLLRDTGYTLIDVPADEYEESATLCANILAVAPGDCVMIDGYPKTRSALENAGVRVRVFDGTALCIGCEGGPTCMTRPIWRAAD